MRLRIDASGIEDIIPISDDRFAIAPEGGRVIERIV
jgi:hypothetical protein